MREWREWERAGAVVVVVVVVVGAVVAGKRSKEHAAAREEGPCCCCSALREHQSATHAPAAVGISQPFPPLLSLSLLRVCLRSPASSLSPPSSIWAVPTLAVLNKSVSETLPRPKLRLARSSRSTRLPALSFVPCVAYVCLLYLSAHPQRDASVTYSTHALLWVHARMWAFVLSAQTSFLSVTSAASLRDHSDNRHPTRAFEECFPGVPAA